MTYYEQLSEFFKIKYHTNNVIAVTDNYFLKYDGIYGCTESYPNTFIHMPIVDQYSGLEIPVDGKLCGLWRNYNECRTLTQKAFDETLYTSVYNPRSNTCESMRLQCNTNDMCITFQCHGYMSENAEIYDSSLNGIFARDSLVCLYKFYNFLLIDHNDVGEIIPMPYPNLWVCKFGIMISVLDEIYVV